MKNLSFLKRFGRRQLIIAGIIVLSALAVIGWLSLTKPRTEAIQFTQVRNGNIESVVSASGTLAGKDTVNLRFKSSGRLGYINVSEGASVEAGQVIAGLDTQDLSIALQQAYNTLRTKQAIADKILDDVKDHSSDETFTQKQTRTQAEADRDNAYDSVKAAQRAFQDAVLTSPIAGIVTKADPVAGQVVSATDVIAQITNLDEIYFDADVDEADIGRVSINQPAKVTLDAYPDRPFEGKVTEIMHQTKTSSSGATTVTVRINLGKIDINFATGLNGQAEVILSQAKNVLFIPQEALRDDDTVLIKSGQGFKPVKVVTGIKSDTDIEIKNGLKQGDQVVTNPSIAKGV